MRRRSQTAWEREFHNGIGLELRPLIQQGKLVSQSSGAIGAALHFMQAYLGHATGDLA